MKVLKFKHFFEDHSLKNRNLKEVYRLIHQSGPIKRADLLELTNFTQTTLVRMIDELLKFGFIYESGMEKSSGGRPPILYQVVSNSSHMIGIDISRTHTTVGLIDVSLQVIEKASFAMTKKHTPQLTIKKIVSFMKQFKNNHHLDTDDILGIGIGSVGPLDRKKGMILTPESFLADGWNHVPIVEEIAKSSQLHTILENGANVAALGEHYASKIKNENTLYCISGIGLRCGVLTDGKIMRNKIGDASSSGHMVIHFDGELCTCGRKGCLIAYISFHTIRHKIMQRIENGEQSVLSEWLKDDEQITLEMIIKAGNKGDHVVHQVVLESAYYYGIGLANQINLIHPEHVILNGKLIQEYPTYYEEVIETARKYVYNIQESVIFSQGKLQESAVIIGATAYLLDSY